MLRVGLAFAIFCVLSGSVYILNDLVDVDADRLHPKKKLRALASGRLSEATARTAISVLVVLCCAAGWLLSPGFLAAALSYFVGNLAYSFSLKKLPYVDVMWIATGFMLRLLAGSFAPTPAIPLSWFLLVTTFSLALFLGFGKRYHELRGTGETTRGVLRKYSARVVQVLLVLTGILAWSAYALYTRDPHTAAMFHTTHLWWSVFPVAIGMARFVVLTLREGHDSPTDAMLRDPLFIVNGLCAGVLLLCLIYG